MRNKKMKELVAREVAAKMSTYKTENAVMSCFAGLSAIAVTALLNARTNKKVTEAVESINQLSEVYVDNITEINDAIKSSNADRDKVMQDISKVLARQTTVFERMDFIFNDSMDVEDSQQSSESPTEGYQNSEDPSSPSNDEE